jgi:DNA-binding transcriptional LysR family regulator
MEPDLDLRDLSVFLAVARAGSFGRAANELTVTQPAVSERIRHLERVTGRPLFERTTRGATPTAAGEQLIPYAERCLAVAAEALEATRRADDVPQFVIAVHSTFAPRVVPTVLGALRSLPRRVVVRDAHSHEVRALVLDGVANVGFTVPAPAVPGLRRTALPPDPVVSVVANDHPLSRRRGVDLAALRDSVLAVNAWGDGTDRFVARLKHAGIDDRHVRYCADAATAATLARDHGHVAFVGRAAVQSDIDHGLLRQVPIKALSGWHIRLDLVHRTADKNDPAIRTIRDASLTLK